MEELVRFVAQNLVEEPEAVEIEVEERGRKVKIQLSVASDDMGRVIGKNGRIANAMRKLTRVAARRQDKYVNVEIR